VLDGVQPVVEATLTDHLWHVAVLVEKPAGLDDVGAEEGGSHQGDAQNFSGGGPDLGIVAAVHSLQEEVVA
jgi:hypothetical protein